MGEFLGEFSLVLHAHLPWVLNHGIWPHGTNWVYEAAAETYIPILMECDKLIKEGYEPRFTIDISPVLTEMLTNNGFKVGFIDYCNQKIKGAKDDYEEFEARGDLSPEEKKNFLTMAKFWQEFYGRTIDYFEKLDRNIIAGFKKLQDEGYIDITTCAATHGYAPLLSHESSIHAQFKVAVDNYKKHFGREPEGTWLAECAYRPGYHWKKPFGNDPGHYRPGVETFLSKNKIKYFFIDTPLLMGGVSQGVYAARFPLLKKLWDQFETEYKQIEEKDFERDPLEPYILASDDAKHPVVIFTRDENTGLLVWSGEHGYPATGGAYLDFHKKHYKDSMGGGSGLRYWKVTHPKADLGAKMQYYMPDINDLLDQNAGHFKEAVKGVLKKFKEKFGHTGHLVAPYDAELFGHWWFEGPWFINRLVRFFAKDPEVNMTNCRLFLESHGMPTKSVRITEGSWGQGSSHYIWLNKENTWTWEKIYEIEDIMENLVSKYLNEDKPEIQRMLKQLARENLILQASDWQFLISTWAARDYAENRFMLHYENCKRLASMIERFSEGKKISDKEWEYLTTLEKEDSLFEEIDVSAWLPDAWKED